MRTRAGVKDAQMQKAAAISAQKAVPKRPKQAKDRVAKRQKPEKAASQAAQLIIFQ
jgi:hypothetical protein